MDSSLIRSIILIIMLVSNIKFEMTPQKVLQPILNTNYYSQHSLNNYDPHRIKESIKNDKDLEIK